MSKRKEYIPNILIIIGSSRKMGNCELIARTVAMNLLQENRAKVTFLRLTDMDIKPCRGCLKCVLADSPCHLNDDLALIHSSIHDADCILLCMPIYGFFPPAIFKLLLDRYYSVSCDANNLCFKKASIIAVGAIKEQAPIVQSVFETYVHFMALELVECYIIGDAQGPGSVLIDEDIVKNVVAVGNKLIDAIGLKVENVCSFCTKNIVQIRGNLIECPMCGKTGKLNNNGQIEWDGGFEYLLSSKNINSRFFSGVWAKSTVKDYRLNLYKIIEQKKKLKEKKFNINWIEKKNENS